MTMPHYPKTDQIRGGVKKVIDAAVKARGELELRYVPLDEDRDIAGKDSRIHQDRCNPKSGIHYAFDQNYKYRGTDADWAALRSAYAWIADPFEHRMNPDPVEFQPMIDDMASTALAVWDDPGQMASSPVSQYVEDAKPYLASWHSNAARTFNTNFTNKLELAAPNQAYIAGQMHHAMIAERDIYVKVRRDLLSLTTNIVHAIEALSAKDAGTFKQTVTTIGAVTGLLTGVITTGIPVVGTVVVAEELVATLACISGFSAMVDKLPEPEKDKHPSPLNAHTVDGVLQNMLDVFHRIDSTVERHEQSVAKSFNSCADLCRSALTTRSAESMNLLPPKPSLDSYSPAQIRENFTPP